MPEQAKLKITAMSVSLAFTLQLVASVWFLSGLSSAIRVNSETIKAIGEEQLRRTQRVYQMDVMDQKVGRMEQDLDEIKQDVKQLIRAK